MSSTLKKNRNIIFCIFILSLLFKPLWLFNNQNLGIPGDDMSYWLHSATISFDYDLDYKNDYKFDSNIFNSETNVPSHPPGAGYLASPFVFLFSQLDKVINNSIEITRSNPVKSFAYLGFFASGLFYTYLGTFFLSKIVKRFNNKYSGLIIFCGLLSSLIHFVSTRFLMAHAAEFFLCSTLIYIFEKNKDEPLNKTEILLMLTTYFFLAITRPSTFLYSLILIFVYRDKFKFNSKSTLIYFGEFSLFSAIYVLLSRKLYERNFMFLNTYGENMNEYTSTINIEQFLNGFLKLPNLFFSTNMGVIFSTPIVFLGVILFFTKQFRKNENKLSVFYLFLYFGASSLPLLIWQGREVAYGQRLLVGVIPLSTLLVCKYLSDHRQIIITKFLTFFSYIGYLLFYSSEKLTLKSGVTLWGTQVGFTAENYYIEVIKAFTNYETILSAILRNIYVVDFLKLFNLRNFLNDSSILDSINIEQVSSFLTYADIYYNLNIYYLAIANVLIFLFSYAYAKLVFSLNN
tara:strand:+ start:2001 stop:3548 length:1548 start_codon:yes stop_codon:yes gene_type:complete